MNVDDVVNALISDDPELAKHATHLKKSLNEMKSGKFAQKNTVYLSSIIETRNKVGLSQDKFAKTLGISVNTLRSWEQGQRKPSAAAALLHLLNKRPELIMELNV